MAHQFRHVVRVLLASPDDVNEERQKLDEVFAELNRQEARDRGLYLELVKFETDTYPSLGRTQQRTFEQIGPFDLLIGLMWSRFGTPTGQADSGTLEELYVALDRYSRKELKDVFWYFRMDDVPRNTVPQQLQKVQEFQAAYRTIGGYFEYRGVQGFIDRVRANLTQWILEQPVLSCKQLGPHTYLLEDQAQNQNDYIQCLSDFNAQSFVSQAEPIVDESDLYYLMVERVVSCEQTRTVIKQALRDAASAAPFLSQVSFHITGLYDTMGKWDVLARFRAPGLLEPKRLFLYLRQQIMRQNPSAALRLINVEREAPSLTSLLNGPWRGELCHRWLGNTKEYRKHQCQRFFLYVELPAADADQRSLLQSLSQVLGQYSMTRIIESVSYASQDSALILEIFTTCSQGILIHELNRLVEGYIPSFRMGKSTLSCFECEELLNSTEVVKDA